MKIKKSILSVMPPLLFAIYSVLALFTNNLGEVLLAAIFRPLLLVIVLAVLLVGVFQLIFKALPKAGLMAAWSLFLFLTYGHLYNLAKGSEWASFLARHRLFVPIWSLLFLILFIGLLRWVQRVERLCQILSLIIGALILFSLFTMSRHYLSTKITEQTYQSSEAQTGIELSIPQNPPDIYYILLDGYTRADVLAERFGFDNGDFLDSLEDLGFAIADCSRANYEHTHLSLPSLMNMAYIDTLVGEIPAGATIKSLRFAQLTKNNRVMQSLQRLGYETVAFETSYYWAQFSEADYYFEPATGYFFAPILSEFEKIFVETTMISALMDWEVNHQSGLFQTLVTPYESHALWVQYTLDKLKELPQMKGPQFVLAHIIAPHPPYIFNQEGVIPNLGDYDTSWETGALGQAGYINNIRYINQEILEVVGLIIEESQTPPVIIIQADHGSDFYDRTMILSAFYLPGVSSQAVYPEITPVNTFRWVFNHTFEASLELLPDRTFSGKYPPFDFHEIEETYSHCKR